MWRLNYEKALDVAKYIITHCSDMDNPVNNLQVQKILYFLQLAYFRKFNHWLFNEDIEAWQYGPVVREVYDVFFGYGGGKIDNSYAHGINGEIAEFMNPIIDELSARNPWDLVNLIHREGTPWYSVYHNEGAYSIIDKTLIARDTTEFF